MNKMIRSLYHWFSGVVSVACLPSRNPKLFSMSPWWPLLGQLSWCPIYKSLLIWRSGTRRLNLRVPDLQMSCRGLISWQCTEIVAQAMAAMRDTLVESHNVLISTDVLKSHQTSMHRNPQRWPFWAANITGVRPSCAFLLTSRPPFSLKLHQEHNSISKDQ